MLDSIFFLFFLDAHVLGYIHAYTLFPYSPGDHQGVKNKNLLPFEFYAIVATELVKIRFLYVKSSLLKSYFTFYLGLVNCLLF
jgi:hypothetical protein